MVNAKSRLLFVLCFCSLFALNQPAVFGAGPLTVGGASPLTVALASGRHFTAELDRRTDATQLWLRWNGRAGHVLRPVDWACVEWAELAGDIYTGRELREAIAVLREALPPASVASGIAEERLTDGSPPPGVGPGGLAPPPPCMLPLPVWGAAHQFEPPRVRSVAIETRVANWDSDVEADGLVLNVFPLDGAGCVLPVRGTIQVELLGEDAGLARSRQPYAVLGRWTEQVCRSEFHADGACYQLPFRRVHPEFDFRWASQGLVHVRLSVPGEGVFETSQSMVRVRPYSAIRDHLEQTTGQRFFVQERTGR